MAIDIGRPRGARLAVLAAFAFATLAVIGRERRTPLPPSRPGPAPAAGAPTAVPAPPVQGRAGARAVSSAGPRGLSCAALSLALPGAGQIHGGARTRGVVMIAAVAALLAGALVLARQDVVFLVGQALRTEVLLWALALNGAILLFRAGSVADAWRLGRRPGGRIARAAMLGALLALVVAPHAVAAWYQWTAYDAVTTIFADVDPADVPAGLPFTGSAIDGTRQDRLQAQDAQARAEAVAAWPPGGRLTVLLLGGDAGPGRYGLRTDTMVVATIDARTRRAALLSLPRNMGAVPLPPAAAGLVPGGTFPDILNALYGWAQNHPDRFPGRDPGATALKLVAANLTGLRVDYYALVDFRGFVEMVRRPRRGHGQRAPPRAGQGLAPGGRPGLDPHRPPGRPPEAHGPRGLRLRPRPQLQLRLRPHPAPALRDGGARPAGRSGPGAAVVPAPGPRRAAEREHRHPAPRPAEAGGAGRRG